MKPRACPPNDGIWFVDNCLMRRYLGLDDLSGKSKINQTKTSQSACHFPGLGNGNPLKFYLMTWPAKNVAGLLQRLSFCFGLW